MKKVLFIILALLILGGCSNKEVKEVEEPPALKVETVMIMKEAFVGTYCWNSQCLDKEGASELVEGEEAFDVAVGNKVRLKINENVKPNEYYLTEMNMKTNKEKELNSIDYTFTAPKKSGVYIYGFTGTWYGVNENEIANTVQYGFKLNVK